MSKEMKDFLSQFITQPEVKPVDILEKKVIEKSAPKPIKEKAQKPEKKAISKSKATELMNHTEGVAETLSIETFLLSINDKKFVFDKKKNLQIDDNLFNVLNLLKQHEGIKSIANLLNALIEKYITDNKDELKTILSKNPLNNF